MRITLWITAFSLSAMGCTGSGLELGSEPATPAPDTSATATFTGGDVTTERTEPVVPFEDAARPEADASVAPNAPERDASRQDEVKEDTAAQESGNFGAPCEDDADCYSGLCVEHRGSTVCSNLHGWHGGVAVDSEMQDARVGGGVGA